MTSLWLDCFNFFYVSSTHFAFSMAYGSRPRPIIKIKMNHYTGP